MKPHLPTPIYALMAGFLGAWVFQFTLPTSDTVAAATPKANTPTHDPASNYTVISTHAYAETVSFVEASRISTPSVVYIKTSMARQVSFNWFDLFFNGMPQTQVIVNSGSGVIFSADGYIITNNHVIEHADEIEVVHNKKTYKARVVGTDPSADLAVLKVETEGLPAVNFGSSKNLSVGDWVLAVGNPFNLESTVTAGIVSAKGRSINIMKGRFPLESFIQTDAAINPGNSGGALVNVKGELVGINTAILSQTGSYVGYGFAVPADIVYKIVKDIIEYGEVQKAFTGVEVEDITTETAKKYNLSQTSGVVIKSAYKEGAASKVGMEQGDILLEIEGESVESKSSFDEKIGYYRPGDKIKVKFLREAKVIESSLTLTNKEGTTELIRREIFRSDVLGAELEIVPKIEKEKLRIESGIRVSKVYGNGYFARMDIPEGFVIVAINNKKMNKPIDVVSYLSKVTGRVIIDGVTTDGQRGYYSFYF